MRARRVSCSGGPCPWVRIADLRHAGTTQHCFWRWLDGHSGAHRAEHYLLTVNLWEWKN